MLAMAMEASEEGQQDVTLALAGINKALTLRSPAALAKAVEAIFLRLPQSGEKGELYYCKSPLGLSHPKDMWSRHSH